MCSISNESVVCSCNMLFVFRKMYNFVRQRCVDLLNMITLSFKYFDVLHNKINVLHNKKKYVVVLTDNLYFIS